MATEDEEFEFRLRAEREAAMRPAGAPAPAAPPPAAPPRREVGFVESAGRTAAASTIPVVKMFGLAAATAARLFGQKAQDKVFAAMDRVTGRMEQEYRPQAGEEFSTAGQIAGGIASMPVEVAGGFGLQHGVERAQEVVQRGGSVGEAGRAGAVTGAVRVGMNALPVKVGGAVGRVVENAAGRVIGGGLTGAGLVGVTGVAGRAAENAALPEGEQFADMRQDVTPSAAELGLGAAFGAVPGALAAAKTLRGAAETPVRDLPRQVPQAENPKGGLAKRAVQPNPALLEAVPAAEKAGLTVLPHHVAEGEAVRALGTAAGGDVYKQNTKAFTKALIKELDPDETAVRLDTKTFHRVLDKQGKTIGENMAKYDMPVDDALRARLEAISKDAADNADADTGRMTMNRVREILGKAEAGEGRITGQAVRELDTAIGRQIRSNTKNQDLVARLRSVQDVLRDTAERQMAPDEAKAVQQARRRYAYAMEILPDIDDFGRTGYYEPGQLWKRLTSSEAGRQRVANERGGLTDLAKAGALVADRSGTGHGYVSVGSSGVGVGASGMRAYASPSRIAEVAIGAIGGKKAYNRFGPGLVKRLAADHDAELARAAQAPEPPPLELAAPDAPMPQGPRPDVRGEAPAEVPEWTTTAGVDAQKPGSQIPAIEPEGLLPAVGDDMPPARINPEPRGRVPDIPAVPGRPDMPDVMVAGGPGEVAGNLASGVTGAGRKGPLRETTGTNEAMQSPGAALAREQQGFAPKKPEPPTGGGTPPIDPRLAKIAELRRQAPSAAVKKVLDAREAEIKKTIKRETDISELEAAAQATDDVDLRQSLLAEANKLRGGKLPVGEVTEGMPDLPKPKAEKIPVGKVIEGQPELPVDKTERIPVGEATEITPEVVEPAPERIPVGEATEMPEPLPVGEVVEDPIPVGDAMEFEQLPVGEATEITPELVVPEATNVDNAPTAPAGGGRSEGMEQTRAAHKMTRQEYEAANPGESYDRALVREADLGEIPYSAIEWKARVTGFGKPKIWAMTRKEIQALADNAARAGRASVAQWRKMAPVPGLPKWAIESHRRMDKASVAHEAGYYRGLLDVHKERVEEAIAHGADVPETVMKDYPDLATQLKENTRAPQEAAQQAEHQGREAAETGDRVQRAAEGAKESWKRMSATEYRLSDPAGGGDFQIVKKGSNWVSPDTGEKWPTLDGAMRGVRQQIAQEAKTRADEAASRAEVGPEPAKTTPAAKPAPRTEAPAAKPTGKALGPAEVKAEFQRQLDAVPRFDDGGPETITLKAGSSTAKIQNTARRVAEYMKALDTVKGGKTPKPVSEKKAGIVGSKAELRADTKTWGGGTGRRAPLTTITDMIDDLDPQAAVDFAAAQGIDLEAALKGDRKRLDRVRNLKPTPEPQEPTGGSNFLEEMYGEQPATPAERPRLFGDVDRKRIPVAYRDPDTGGTWSGRGMKPKWLQDALAAGKSLESFEAGKVPAKGQIEGVQLADAHRKSVPFGTVFSYSALGKQKQKLAYELEKLGVPKARAAQIVQDAATMTPGDRGARFLSLAEVRRAAESAGVLFTP